MVEALHREPQVISSGMGVGITTHEHALAVALAAKELELPVLSVVSGTGLPNLLVSRLHAGDERILHALNVFNPDIAKEIMSDYLPNGPRPAHERHKIPPKPEVLWSGSEKVRDKFANLSVAAGFCEVWLAQRDRNGEPHGQPIGINVLEKVQLMHLPILLGAMLADVNYVLVGAGIPNQIPQILDRFGMGETASYRLYVEGTRQDYSLTLDPRPYLKSGQTPTRPKFFPIVSFDALATYLEKKVGKGIHGYVVEGCFGKEPWAGGHNANPREEEYWDDGQPRYGPKDVVNLQKILALGKPVYLAGGQDDQLQAALQLGATGIGVGTAFALDDESGMEPQLKQLLRKAAAQDRLVVKTSCGSPTGFAFQVVQMEGTLSDPELLEARKRVCNVGHLVQIVASEAGKLIFRCSAEPVEEYVAKGGEEEDTEGSICLCNALVATGGFPNLTKAGTPEIKIGTLGKKHDMLRRLVTLHPDHRYTARDVLVNVFAANKS